MEPLTGAYLHLLLTFNFLSVTVILFSLVIAIFAPNWKYLLIAAIIFPILEWSAVSAFAYMIFGSSGGTYFSHLVQPLHIILNALTFAAYLFWCSLLFTIKQQAKTRFYRGTQS